MIASVHLLGADLERTTGTKGPSCFPIYTFFFTVSLSGLINEKDWYGAEGMEHARTIREPKQSIPTLLETLTLLLKVCNSHLLPGPSRYPSSQDENKHVQLNIDCKVNNDPDRLFSTMHTCISSFSDWETLLAPRILLGLWHSSFITPALKHVAYLRRAYIGRNPHVAREYFWSHVEAFSIE